MITKNTPIAHQSLSTFIFTSQKQTNSQHIPPKLNPHLNHPILNHHTNPRYTNIKHQTEHQTTTELNKKSSHARKNSATNTYTGGMHNNNSNSNQGMSNGKKRNKCETQGQHVGVAQRLLQCQSSRNKRNYQTLQKSKKTLRKQKQKIKSSQAETSILLCNKLKLSQNYNNNQYEIYQQSLTLKSSGKHNNNNNNNNNNSNRNSHSKTHQKSNKSSSNVVNKNWTAKKQLFQSTCFSRHIDQDLEFMQEIFNSGSQMNMMPNNHSNSLEGHDHSSITQEINIDLSIDQKKKQKYNRPEIVAQQNYKLKAIIERAKLVLGAYQNKCSQLTKNCEYYKIQLNKANKQLMRASRHQIQGKSISNNNNNNSNGLKKSNHSTGNVHTHARTEHKTINNERKASRDKSRDLNNNINNNNNKSSIRSTYAGKG